MIVSNRVILVSLLLTAPALARAQSTIPLGPDVTSPQVQTEATRRVQDAIPITPEMIRDLARRYQENSRTQEETLTSLASPASRAVAVNFAPGAATSIIQTVKGYPTALSFFDSTCQRPGGRNRRVPFLCAGQRQQRAADHAAVAGAARRHAGLAAGRAQAARLPRGRRP